MSKKISNKKHLRKLTQDQKNKLLQVKDLYDQLGTLQKVGDALNITRERVRQLLQKGSDNNLYEYKTTRETNLLELTSRIDKEMLIEVIKMESNKFSLCTTLQINFKEYLLLIKYYGIDATGYALDRKQRKYVNLYMDIVNELGKHPSTTELQGHKKWRYIERALSRMWGGFDNFRLAFGIPKPPFALHPNTKKAFELAMAKRSLAKQKNIETVLRLLAERGSLNAREIGEKLGVKQGAVSLYLTYLIKLGKVQKVGTGRYIKYSLV